MDIFNLQQLLERNNIQSGILNEHIQIIQNSPQPFPQPQYGLINSPNALELCHCPPGRNTHEWSCPARSYEFPHRPMDRSYANVVSAHDNFGLLPVTVVQ